MRLNIYLAVLLLLAVQSSAALKSELRFDTGPDVCPLTKCDSCTVDDDCLPQHYCYMSTTSEEGFCRAYSFFSHMTWRNIVAPFVFFLTAAIAAGAGTTGLGSVNTPLLLSLLSLSTTEMVPPAQGSIAGASITSLVMWMTRGHPRDPQLPIINADVLLLLLPAMLVGVMFGLTLQSVFPQWFLFLLMTIMTGWSSHKTITKARGEWAKENAAIQAAAEAAEKQSLIQADDQTWDDSQIDVDSTDPVKSSRQPSRTTWHSAGETSSNDPVNVIRSTSIRPVDAAAAERRRLYAWKLATAVIVFIIVAILNMLRGGRFGKVSLAGIKFCSTAYWTFTALMTPLLFGVCGYIGYYLVNQYRCDVEKGWHRDGVDIVWTTQRAIIFPIFGFLAGMSASLVAVGVGLLLTPIMLDLHLDAEVVAANSAMLHLMSSMAALIAFALSSDGLWSHSAILAAVSMFGQIFGQAVVDMLIRKYNRRSIITIVMAIMIGSASILLVTLGSVRLYTDIQTKQHLSWNPVCTGM